MEGLLKRYWSPINSEMGIECWKDKRDKDPARIRISDIYEYSVNNQVRRILKDYRPFPHLNIYLPLTEVDVVSKGKIDLLQVPMDKPGYSPAIYVVEDSLRFLTALPNTREIYAVLAQFIPANYLQKYLALHSSKMNYSEIPILIHGYNTETYYIKLKTDQIILLQASQLIEKATTIIGLNFSEINQKPDAIIGDVWKSIDGKSQADSLIHRYHAFEIETGGLNLGADKDGKIITMQFFPKKVITLEKLNSFLTMAYKDKLVENDKDKYPTFVTHSDDIKIAFSAEQVIGLHYLLIVNLSYLD